MKTSSKSGAFSLKHVIGPSCKQTNYEPKEFYSGRSSLRKCLADQSLGGHRSSCYATRSHPDHWQVATTLLSTPASSRTRLSRHTSIPFVFHDEGSCFRSRMGLAWSTSWPTRDLAACLRGGRRGGLQSRLTPTSAPRCFEGTACLPCARAEWGGREQPDSSSFASIRPAIFQ